MPKPQCNVRKTLIDQIAELVAGLVQMQDDKGVRVGLSDMLDVLIPRNLEDLTIFHLLGPSLQLLHSLLNIHLGKLILKI